MAACEEKGGRGRNTTKHAATVVSTVRERYAKGRNRRIGQKKAEGRNSAIFMETLKGLETQEPQPRPPRQPILVKHMRKLHAALDLEGAHEDRAFWCLTLRAWLRMRHIGDFTSSREKMRRR